MRLNKKNSKIHQGTMSGQWLMIYLNLQYLHPSALAWLWSGRETKFFVLAQYFSFKFTFEHRDFFKFIFLYAKKMWKSCKSLIFLLNHWFACMCLFKVKTSDLWKSLSKRIRIERILLKTTVYNQMTRRNAKELSVAFTP